MTGASSSLVAIVGGLLVARFISLDSEQQGAQRNLDAALDELEVAKTRDSTASTALRNFEAEEFLSDSDVLDSIQSGTTRISTLRALYGDEVPIEDEELAPYVHDAYNEFESARSSLDIMLSKSLEVAWEAWDELDWFEHIKPRVIEWKNYRREEVWERALEEVKNARKTSLEESGAGPADRGLGIMLPPVMPRMGTPVHVTEQRRGPLRAAESSARRELEDAERTVARLREARNAIVKPDKQFQIGIVVLVYTAIVGIVVPIVTLSTGPAEFTGWVMLTVWFFLSGLLALIGYLVGLAIRLARRRN